MAGLIDSVDPDGLLEYSVVYTDRSVNHMSARFQQTMKDIHTILTDVYAADRAVVVPGSGTFGMEAVARQFCRSRRVLVVRNGWFSYRWSQILESGGIAEQVDVLKARPVSDTAQSAFEPVPIEELTDQISRDQPAVVCAPHVETSAGLMLPDGYLQSIAAAVHAYGGLFVLDCVASGTHWIDMRALGVDVLVTAPQKGWSGSPCAGLVMLSSHACKIMETTSSDSFSIDLKRWSQIMETYLDGKHAYHATMPTDGLIVFRDVMKELQAQGFPALKQAQTDLGLRIRELLENAGFASVAAPGFKASGVAVYYTDNDDLHTGRAFAEVGLQIAAGVPLQIDEPADFKTFRVGLFGIDKLTDVDAAVDRFAERFTRVCKGLGIAA